MAGEPFNLGTGYLIADATYTFDLLRYWVTALKLQHTDGSWFEVPSAYYLIEQTETNTRLAITIDAIPPGDYEAFSYDIGVDYEHNHNLDMFEGELEAGIDMDWGWNSGFIFLKTEGSWSGGTTFGYHIGTDANLRTVTHTLDAPLTIGGPQAHIDVHVDVSRLFEDFDTATHHFIAFAPKDKAAEVMENFVSGHALTAP